MRLSLADSIAAAIAPALIVVMVVSLLYFLLEVLYVGRYAARLQWIFFFFTSAVVLIARMSMEASGANRSGIYGLVLAVVTFAALQSFVEYPADSPLAPLHWLINLGLMTLVWWAAHRLTWDCTYIEETADVSGTGLLAAAGLEKNSLTPDTTQAPDADNDIVKSGRAHRGRRGSAFLSWLERYQEYQRQRRQKPHPLGIWVIYFSLAALPLFGLGQALIPLEDPARRRYAFWLMGAYVAGGLGLLLTTSFLSLRRYLRQRHLKMPIALAGTWLTIGSVMIIVLLLLGALLPRPNAEYQLFRFTRDDTPPDRDASRFAVLRDSPTKRQGRPGDAQQKSPDKDAPPTASKSGDQQQSGQRSSVEDRKSSSDDQAANQKSQSSSSAKNKTQSGPQTSEDRNSKSNPSESTGSASQGQASTPLQRLIPHGLRSLADTASSILKWIMFAIATLVVAFLVLRGGLKFLANFTGWARSLLDVLHKWWQTLFGWSLAAVAVERADEPRPKPKPRPFAAYMNPFLSGAAEQRSPEALVRYTFEALEAWALEKSLSRCSDETPLEFAARIAEAVPQLEGGSRRLASLYARVAYAPDPLPASSISILRDFWQKLEHETLAGEAVFSSSSG
jgi:hypothetical protein